MKAIAMHFQIHKKGILPVYAKSCYLFVLWCRCVSHALQMYHEDVGSLSPITNYYYNTPHSH